MRLVRHAISCAAGFAFVIAAYAATLQNAAAEPRRSLGHNTVGTSYPYHPGYFRFWFGDRDIGLLEPFYPVPPSGYYVNPDIVPPYPAERQHSRNRHVTGTDLSGLAEGARSRFDVDSWYGWEPSTHADDATGDAAEPLTEK